LELNQWGQIVMSPASVRHVVLQDAIATLLRQLLAHGRVLQAFPMETPEGVKVPDVIWISGSRFRQIKEQVTSSLAPEICVEVICPSNSKPQMIVKKTLYFQAGVEEVWLCHENGEIEFYTPTEKLLKSERVLDFSEYVET
jgi:Uma2 family endonuclease